MIFFTFQHGSIHSIHFVNRAANGNGYLEFAVSSNVNYQNANALLTTFGFQLISIHILTKLVTYVFALVTMTVYILYEMVVFCQF